MIEHHAFVPMLFVMASFALFTFLAFVHVVAAVTGKAGGMALVFLNFAAMTVLARHILMCAL